ncbi:N-acetyltransferase [Exiguobacterium sp. SH1S4]|nr:N-acetyltransferase [Exiguobacterium sp. SH4S7]TCI48591.1 N-acetyltransferase [Exiguobacterium sp. SH5S32]TCI55477.1 N-acetyltransferase [Exiguobacterium sp. SH1S4]TCI63486.1 N-acetyltransferase [Exiguobacterium sp. SH0S2]TCI75273.1 N-acetyltransferase [Exiguobacterium sp. SH1S1]TCI76174.1 N-acetyltransferase [Exiguobacterium sp. SH0S1]
MYRNRPRSSKQGVSPMAKRPITNLEYSDKERESFFYLTDEMFGIDFRGWYLDGEWTDRYRCYSLTFYRNIISNVSMSRMTLVTDGTAREMYQIGTVMTDEDRQGQGLATRVFKHLFKQHDADGLPYILACNEGLETFYEKQGFTVQREPELFVSVSGSAPPLEHVDVDAERWRRFKLESLPYSPRLYTTDDMHIWMFSFYQGLNEDVYRFDDVHVIYFIERTRLHLFAVLSPRPVDMRDVVARLSFDGIAEIVFEFTPDLPDVERRAARARDGQWMIRMSDGHLFPEGCRFPSLSKA